MMHVACGANAAYMPYAAAMLHSLLVQKHAEQICVHFMCDDALPAAERDDLQNMVDRLGGIFRAHEIDTQRLSGLRFTRRHGREIWYRILLPELLPELPRVLYLDADTLVLRPIEELWHEELGDKIAGAIHNPMYPWGDASSLEEMEIAKPSDYFNSGVLLMDLDGWRAQNITGQLRRYVRQNPEKCTWPDQNALNAVLGRGLCKPLSPVWNAQNVYFDSKPADLPLARSALWEVRNRPRIVHFIAPYKPLDYLCKHPYRQEFFKHLAATPWAGARLHGKTLINRLLRLLPQPMMWVVLLVKWPRLRRRLRRLFAASG